MNKNQYLKAYRKNAITSASPLQLVIMLYDGAIKNIEAGKNAMQKDDYFNQNKHLLKAQDIVNELTSAIDIEKGGEISTNLLSLYDFIFNSLVQSNIQDDPRPLDDCINILSQLRESWSELEKTQQQTPTAEEEAIA